MLKVFYGFNLSQHDDKLLFSLSCHHIVGDLKLHVSVRVTDLHAFY